VNRFCLVICLCYFHVVYHLLYSRSTRLGMPVFVGRIARQLTLVYIYIGEYGYMRNGGDDRGCIYSGVIGMVSKGVSAGEAGEIDRIASISCS